MGFVILGGGISGLTAAYYLRQCGCREPIKLIESSSRLGGWINTHFSKKNTLYELGPRTLRVYGEAGFNSLRLADDLGIGDKIIPIKKDHPSTLNRMIKVDGKLHLLPNSLKHIFRRREPFSKPLAFYLWKDYRTKKKNVKEESFHSFVDRRLGPEIANLLISSMCRGIFAGDSKEISVLAFARSIFEGEQKHGSITKYLLRERGQSLTLDNDISQSISANRAHSEKWEVWSLESGLSTLVDTLMDKLGELDVEIIKDSPVEEVAPSGKNLHIACRDQSVEASTVISSLPLYKLADVTSNLGDDITSILRSVPYVTTAVVNLEFDGTLVSQPAFGYLVPECEPSRVLGVIFDTESFPQEGKTILTVMMGGAWFDSLFGSSTTEEEFYKIAVDEVRQSLGIQQNPSDYKVSILKNCIPQYTVGHFDRIYNAKLFFKERNLPLYLAGNAINGVGVNDAILTSKNLASYLAEKHDFTADQPAIERELKHLQL